MHEPPSTQPDLPQPGPRGRQGRPSGLPSKPSSPGIGQPGTADRSRPRSRSTERRRRPRTAGTGASRDCGRPGPRRVRTLPETPGPRRAPAVTTGAQEPQVTRPSPLPPGTAKQQRAGFEPLTPAAAGLRPLPTRLASPWTGLALRLSWRPLLSRPSQLRPRRPCPRRALSVGSQRSPTVNKGR
jgi:hypothetical protein